MSVRAVAGTHFLLDKINMSCLLLVSSGFRLSELWSAINRLRVLVLESRRGCGKDGAVKTSVVRFIFPGDGGFHRSVADGPCLRGGEASSVPPSSALVSGG
ncbi:hypothetical protein F2Q69_00062997 [Brassica cretica]|uniref:Uncharacterized protein n=1 Tax=Brassica cretica TaxID=69181 RepID=A0A8S9RJ98_BRACR|nr:hypothetical protein F2Q69_00062997 [Brassica cretica]